MVLSNAIVVSLTNILAGLLDYEDLTTPRRETGDVTIVSQVSHTAGDPTWKQEEEKAEGREGEAYSITRCERTRGGD